ncbi:MAG TPA: glycosyltransferase [Actinomycetota bacterium]|nr:glycosyltransferase [Actinomycetota bacterium]
MPRPPRAEPLRLLVFAQSLHPRGTEKSLVRILRHLDRGAFRPALVLAAARGPYLRDVPDDVEVVDLGLHDRPTALAVPRLARWIRRNDPDVALAVHTSPGRVLAAARRLSRRVPYVALEADPFSRNEGRKRFYPLRRSLTRRALAEADAIVCVSQVVRRDLVGELRIDPSDVEMLPHACYDDDLAELAGRPAGDEWLEAPGPPVVAAVGNMYPEKDQATLVEAVARLDVPARLVVVGEGPLRGELRELAARRGVDLHMPGFRANPYPYLRHAGVYASSSVSEGFDISQVEAMALAKPVVVTAGDRFEAVEDGRTGLVVPPRDPAALAAALGRLLTDRAAARAMGERAAEAAAPLSAEAVTRRYEDLLLRVARDDSVPA